jgi:hypothetical protein
VGQRAVLRASPHLEGGAGGGIRQQAQADVGGRGIPGPLRADQMDGGEHQALLEAPGRLLRPQAADRDLPHPDAGVNAVGTPGLVGQKQAEGAQESQYGNQQRRKPFQSLRRLPAFIRPTER